MTLNGRLDANSLRLSSIFNSTCESSILSVCRNSLDAATLVPSSLNLTSAHGKVVNFFHKYFQVRHETFLG